MMITRIAILGAGTMGIGIAEVAAAHGCHVKLYDIDPSAANQAIKNLSTRLDKRIAKGKITDDDKQSILTNILSVDALDALHDRELVIEAVVEKLSVKQDLFQQLEQICSAQTILASNTSSISITAIATHLQHPQRILGLHFFNPAPIMKLVEVIAGIKTAEVVLDKAVTLVKSWGKVAVKAQSGPGFIVNRVARPFYGEALKMKQEQLADPATIDACLQAAAGFRMGPFALMDLIGIDVNFQVSKTVYHAMFEDPRYRPSLIQSEMVAAGLLGRKSGQGFYHYNQQKTDQSSPYSGTQKDLPKSIQLNESDHPFEQLLSEVRDICQVHSGGLNQVGDTVLFQTVGHCAGTLAQQLKKPVCLVDWSFDYQQAKAVNVCFSEQVIDIDKNHIIAMFQAINKQVVTIDDMPGMINARVLSMLINEAADAVFNGVATAEDVDLAMQYGTNYPQGLLAYAEYIGWQNPASVLTELQQWFGDDRYRLSPYIRRQL
ncbi:3-hydroxyacyl-CoA dehydrogenase [Marinicella gelatinilytica]|uniref:3-hydroxyacyl-CoA dehydrogenase n=1 Tax=Marinicella gelatinilytica TaxID=2996017 RepID=UPI002260B262|nr:3-hydroxyacyl-CoA dehydrogenase [Marinicella gelatinilytica]MCX7543769.1 3-hydroxyacyl-CoA dehydrogenase [Marinicella gelatinilytica]